MSRIEASLLQARCMRLYLQLFPFAPFAAHVWVLRHNLTCLCLLARRDCRGDRLPAGHAGPLSLALGPTGRIVVPDGDGLTQVQ